jgi:hypothetical protein
MGGEGSEAAAVWSSTEIRVIVDRTRAGIALTKS